MHSVRKSAHGGFTLVELLVVITIIGILMSLFLGALWSAGQTARRANTRTLITKLHNRIMSKYEEYQTRRLPIQPSQPVPGMSVYEGEFRLETARRKLYATRELMRMEMPDRYSDLTFIPVHLVNYGGSGDPEPAYPFLRETYHEQILASQRSQVGMEVTLEEAINRVQIDNQSAECLFMVVSYAVDDPVLAVDQFSPKDYGDTDGDGMLEFIDAWGRPIWWLRWAPGFVSDLQPQFSIPVNPTEADPRAELFDPSFIQAAKDPQNQAFFVVRDAIRYSDPFNPLKVDRWEPKHSEPNPAHRQQWRFIGYPEYGWHITPLIMSSGPNADFGINFAFTHEPVMHPRFRSAEEAYSDPYTLWRNADGAQRMRGVPISASHLDNVHNHFIETR